MPEPSQVSGGPPPDAAYSETRVRQVDASPQDLWRVVAGVGGGNGWYAANPFWRARAGLDRLVGGPGMRGRPRQLRSGDEADFWRVVDVSDGERLLLRAEMRMPGTPWLELAVAPSDSRPGRSVLTQRTWFQPANLLGHAMWWAELPGHKLVFARMVDNLAREAERRSS